MIGVAYEKLGDDPQQEDLTMPTNQRSTTTAAVAAAAVTAALIAPLPLLSGCGDCCNEPPTDPPTKAVTLQERQIDPRSVVGKIREVSIGEDFKVRFVKIGEDFTIRYVSIGEGAADSPLN